MGEQEISIRGRILRQIIARSTSDLLIGKKIKTGELRKNLVEPLWRCPEEYTMEEIEREHYTMKWLCPKESCHRTVILQLHGGGYISQLRNAYYDWACLYSELSKESDVLTIEYRVAPEHPFPAALLDAFDSYLWLLEQGYEPEKIVVVGDSAGGGLAMALCHYLKEKKIPLPAGLIAMSPWTDLTLNGESYVTNFELDPLFGKSTESMIFNRDYVADHDPKDPLVSPLYGDFAGFPPMLLQVGSIEMLLSDSLGVAVRAKESGVQVKLSIYEGMFHEFQMAGKLLPESRRAWEEVGEYFHAIQFGEV